MRYYPRTDELNRLPRVWGWGGNFLIFTGLILFIPTASYSGIVLLLTGVSLSLYSGFLGSAGHIEIDSAGITFKKRFVGRERSVVIPFQSIEKLTAGKMDLGEMRGRKRYYSELEIHFTEVLWRSTDVWKYWNMLSYTMPKEICLNEQHWKRKDLTAMGNDIKKVLDEREIDND